MSESINLQNPTAQSFETRIGTIHFPDAFQESLQGSLIQTYTSGQQRLEDLLQEDCRGLTRLGSGLIGTVIDNVIEASDRSNNQYVRSVIGGVCIEVGRHLAPETTPNDLDTIATAVVEQCVINDNGRLATLINYYLSGRMSTLRAYEYEQEALCTLCIDALWLGILSVKGSDR